MLGLAKGLHDLPGNIAKGWTDYFRLRFLFGQEQPPVSVVTVPTILLDDNSKGPYPVYRPVIGEAELGANPTRSHIMIVNNDSQDLQTMLVVDYIIFKTSVAANIVQALGRIKDFQIQDPAAAPGNYDRMFDAGSDRVVDIAPKAPGTLLMGAAILATQLVPTFTFLARNSVLCPNNDVNPHRLDGPWLLAPGAMLVFAPDIDNCGISVFARCRYYPRP
jgi:hypothetical protein